MERELPEDGSGRYTYIKIFRLILSHYPVLCIKGLIILGVHILKPSFYKTFLMVSKFLQFCIMVSNGPPYGHIMFNYRDFDYTNHQS